MTPAYRAYARTAAGVPRSAFPLPPWVPIESQLTPNAVRSLSDSAFRQPLPCAQADNNIRFVGLARLKDGLLLASHVAKTSVSSSKVRNAHASRTASEGSPRTRTRPRATPVLTDPPRIADARPCASAAPADRGHDRQGPWERQPDAGAASEHHGRQGHRHASHRHEQVRGDLRHLLFAVWAPTGL